MQAQAASERGSQADVVTAAEELQVSLLPDCQSFAGCTVNESHLRLHSEHSMCVAANSHSGLTY